MKAERRSRPDRPTAIVLLALASSILGVVATYLFPEVNRPGLNPVTGLLFVMIFGGMLAMLVGAAAVGAETPREEVRRMRAMVRYLLAVALVWGLVSTVSPAFGFIAGLLLAGRVEPLLRRAFAWIGKV